MRSVRRMLTGIFLMLCAILLILFDTDLAVAGLLAAGAAVCCFISGFCTADVPPRPKPGPEPDPGYTGMPDPDLPHCPHCNKQHGPQLDTCPYCGTKLK